MATFTKPPSKIKIGPEVFTVLLVKNLKTLDGKDDAWGMVEFNSRVISLHPVMSPGKALNILLHEISHAALWVYSQPANRTYDEEEFVTCTSLGLATVLIDNPKLVTWINKIIKGLKV